MSLTVEPSECPRSEGSAPLPARGGPQLRTVAGLSDIPAASTPSDEACRADARRRQVPSYERVNTCAGVFRHAPWTNRPCRSGPFCLRVVTLDTLSAYAAPAVPAPRGGSPPDATPTAWNRSHFANQRPPISNAAYMIRPCTPNRPGRGRPAGDQPPIARHRARLCRASTRASCRPCASGSSGRLLSSQS